MTDETRQGKPLEPETPVVARRMEWARSIGLAAGIVLVVTALAVYFGLPWNVALPLVTGLGAWGFAATMPTSIPRGNPNGWWRSFVTVRTAVASLIAILSIFLIWWGWWQRPANGKEIMDTMISLITAVLGYLFGRGEAENAEGKAADADKRKDIAVESYDALKKEAQEAGEKAERAAAVLAELGERAKVDKPLEQHVMEAYRKAKEDIERDDSGENS